MSCGSTGIPYLGWPGAVTLGVVILLGVAPSRGVEAQETTVRSVLDALERYWPLQDDEWLEDADGRRYYIARFSKTEGPYLLEDGGRQVRYQRFFVWDLADEDDD